MPRITTVFALTFGLFLASDGPWSVSKANAQSDMIMRAGPVELPSGLAAQPLSHLPSPVWVGLTTDGLPAVLVIEQTGPEGAIGVLMSVHGQSWHRGVGVAKPGALTFRLKDRDWTGALGAHGSLHLMADDGWQGISFSPNALDTITSHDWVDDFHGAEEIMISGPMEPNGTPSALKTLIYSPPGAGPFPLAVLNHGSTDSGNDALAMQRVWTQRHLAEMLVERGFLVAVPQRRGRGGSSGIYGEGLSTTPGAGYSCNRGIAIEGFERGIEDIDAAIISLRALPQISDAPALIVGNSRGGALSMAYAGRAPDMVRGVINVVGGWVEEACEEAYAINRHVFSGAHAFQGPNLWLYGSGDTVYSPRHSQALFAAYRTAGGQGTYLQANLPWDGSGHMILSYPKLYHEDIAAFLDDL